VTEEGLSLFTGTPDQIDLYYFGRGHTDGDTFVVFKDARTMHVGDMFLEKTLPFIDAENGNGGSAIEFGRTLTQVIDNVRAGVATGFRPVAAEALQDSSARNIKITGYRTRVLDNIDRRSPRVQ
jgi:glyoxylase-like metal-dependent hydrolase (beta-lactamase superfamily II)